MMEEIEEIEAIEAIDKCIIELERLLSSLQERRGDIINRYDLNKDGLDSFEHKFISASYR